MTDTLVTDIHTDQSGALAHLDPHTLVVDTNIRNAADLKAEFIASIKEHGVLTPIVAVRGDDGQVMVRMGQRRTLAAREAGLTSVPVYVRPLTEGDEIAHLVDRVAEQIVENDHRADITEADRAHGIQQLLDAGVSVTRIAKKLAVKKDTVKAVEAVGKSDAAKDALETGQLSLTEAAALAEFEDTPDALHQLARVAGTPRFDHVVAQLRQEQTSRRAFAQAESIWREKGFAILDEHPRSWDVECVGLQFLHTGDGEPVDEQAATDPALWAVLIEEEDAWVDLETGQAVDDSDIDWNTEDDPEANPAEGMRHFNTVKDGTVYVPTYYCRNYAAAGLSLSARFARFAGVTVDSEMADSDEQTVTAAAREAAAAEAQDEQAERQRRDRRMVVALNRLGLAAQQVRREFVAKLLARKTLSKGAAIFIASCLARDPGLIAEHRASDIAAELLGASTTAGVHKLVADLAPNGDARAQVITLAIVLAALEGRTPKDAWRYGGGGYGGGVGRADYLALLVASGYQLADVERVVIGERSADEVYDATLTGGTDEPADDADPGDE